MKQWNFEYYKKDNRYLRIIVDEFSNSIGKYRTVDHRGNHYIYDKDYIRSFRIISEEEWSKKHSVMYSSA